MTTQEIGKKLVDLCKQNQNEKAIDELYDRNIVSVEAASMPGMPQQMTGIEAVKGKNMWWAENHTVHSATAEGPYPNGDRFAVRFKMDITNKPSGKRTTMEEVAVYTVKNDKIVREEFFYPT